MKIIEKLTFNIFSCIMIILSIVLCLILYGWIDLNSINNIIEYCKSESNISLSILIICAIIILLAIKCIFFSSEEKDEAMQKEGVILENSDGKLLISKETLQSLISSVAKGFNGAENINSKVYVDKENNLNVYVTLYVHSDAIIKDLSINLQTKIKEAIKNTSDLEVKEINIKIKDIAPEKNIIEE